MKQFKTIIFDWDGTLMDSAGRIVSAMQTSAQQVGIPVPSEEAVRHIIGLSLDAVFEQLFPDTDPAIKPELFEAYRFQYVEGDPTPSPLFTGAEEVLQFLKTKGICLAVATGKGRQGLHRVMTESALTHYFDDSICADEAESKPHPDMIHRLLERNSWEKQSVLMIGDTTHDLQMAQSAGIQSLGVSYGAHPKENLLAFDPLHVLDDIRELMALY
ncbi:HAD family hydrolase [Pleionea sediminis]|uniref:HAD family hydrolase n=1 Tax=Pleionea sediminis TaxID=2569479 RepID=UPI0011852B53|nr:HAD-IA family hydrolase [Pleionea sediminis]